MKNDSALQALLNLNSGSCDIGRYYTFKKNRIPSSFKASEQNEFK